MTPRELLISVKAAKTHSATRAECPGQKGHYLSAYLSVFKVYSHELMPGEIIAICKQNRKPQWVLRLPFAHVNGTADPTRQLWDVREKDQSVKMLSSLFFFMVPVGHVSDSVSSFPLALCAPVVLCLPQEAKPFEHTPGSTVDPLYESGFCCPVPTGAGSELAGCWSQLQWVSWGEKLQDFFAENWSFVTSKSPPLRKGACSYLDKLQRSQAVSEFSCAMHILTIQVLELTPMKESLSTWVSLLSRKGVWDLFWPKARIHS